MSFPEIPTNDDYVSSTGQAGVSLRPFDRMYDNVDEFMENGDQLQGRVEDLLQHLGEQDVGRVVLRGLARTEAVDQLAKSALGDTVEVHLPLDEFGHEGVSLIYAARNIEGRDQPLHPLAEMVAATNRSQPTDKTLEQRFKDVAAKGYRLLDHLESYQKVEEMLDLWGDTFGFRYSDLVELKSEMHTQNNLADPGQRTSWLTVIDTPLSPIGSGTKAERIDLPGPDGSITFVENTDWATLAGEQGRGLMSVAAAATTAQVLRDLSPTTTPVIYAETNYLSGAHHAGHAAGMRIPDRPHDGSAPAQMLVQNVGVHDGYDHEHAQNKLRDFSFQYLPRGIIELDYADLTKLASYIQSREPLDNNLQ